MKPDQQEYYSTLARIALPIIFQNLISSSLNMVDVLMIGQLGETAVASVGLGNQVTFLLMFLLFGVTSGSAVFSAQFWGKNDITSIHKVLGIGITLALTGSALFMVIALGFPHVVLSIYTSDPEVIRLGAPFLSMVGLTYPFMALTASFSSTLRSTGDVRLPVVSSTIALVLKTALGYALIFGHFGLPVMGIMGIAVATMIARALECGLLLTFVYVRRTPVAAPVREYFSYSRAFALRVLKTSLPVVFNEILWSLGITTYTLIYARISTEAVAASNISGTIENLAFVIFIGISDACGIMVGNKIGAGKESTALDYGRRTLILTTIGAILMGGIIYLFSPLILSLYKVSPSVTEYTRRILLVVSLFLWIRTSNMTIVVGVLRSGGDTRFGLILDAGSVWLVGVPMALLGAFVLHLPVYWVYTMVMGEELAKYIVGMIRVVSKKWIHNLTQPVVEITI